jgi:tripartite-type tricarboxylate transporter receptor subunit TctC
MSKSLGWRAVLTTLAAGAAPLLAWSINAAAQRETRDSQNFPTRPVRMVNPYTPGGSVDLVARALAGGLTEIWGQQVIVDNRPGAGTQIGTEIVVRAEPDGYTMLCTSSAIAIIPSMYKSMRFDAARDVSPVALISNSPSFLVVHPSVPAKSVKELIALARAQPGQLTGASSGVGATIHLKLEMFKAAAKIDILHVPYKGGAPAITDLIGGQVKVFFNTPGTLLQHVKTGRLRALGITSAQRVDYAPDIPTIAEAGLPGFEAYIWYAVYGPKALPANLLHRWNDAANRYLASAKAQEHLRTSFMAGVGGTPEAFAQYHQSEIKRWAVAVAAAGIKPQ